MSKVPAIIDNCRQTLLPLATSMETPEEERLDAYLPVEKLVPAVKAMADSRCGYLSAITGMDPGVETGQLEALYHFACGPVVVSLRISVPRDDPKLPTVCDVIPSASFFERELSEMFGIIVEGTPNSDKLFLPEDWPDGVYPLRKDFSMTQLDAES